MATLKNPFGADVSYTVNRDGSLNLDRDWVAAHIGLVYVKQLAGVDIGGGRQFSGKVTFYKAAMPQLVAAFATCERLGVAGDVLTYAGSFVPRLKRGSKTSPSNHSLGTAFDINAAWNGFKVPPAPAGAKGNVQRLLPVFRAYGFTCGADWKNTPDGMHFEINRILSAPVIAATHARFAGGATSPLSKAVVNPARAAPLFLLNDFALSNSQNREGALWAPVDDVAQALGIKGERIAGRFYAPVVATIEALGFSITKRGNQIAENNRYYLYAGRKP